MVNIVNVPEVVVVPDTVVVGLRDVAPVLLEEVVNECVWPATFIPSTVPPVVKAFVDGLYLRLSPLLTPPVYEAVAVL